MKPVNALLMTLLSTSTVVYAASDHTPLNAGYDKGYLTFKSADNRYQMKLDGRIMLDTGAISSDKNELKSDTDFRRARLAFKTTYDQTWAGEFDLDFSGNKSKIKDMWLAYVAIPHVTLKFGNQKPLFSMAEVTTSRWYPLMETPMVADSFGTGRRIGFSASYWQDRYFIGASVFGDEVGVNNSDTETSETFGFSSRGLYRPWLSSPSRFFHIGYNYLKHTPQSNIDEKDDSNKYKFKAGLESEIGDYQFLDTGNIKKVDDITTYGLEFAAQYDRWMLAGEYLTTKVTREDELTDYEADGFYVEGSYFLIGSGRSYNLSDGEFGPVLPQNQHGDLELVARYSTLDLNDSGADIFGGSSDNITIGLNWYAHSNIVFRLNYIRAGMDEHADADGDLTGDDTVTSYALRMQYLF